MDNDREFLESFLEDYFAECDEHLLSIKKGLLLLEELVDKGEIDREVLERLLRNFHTIKGLSAMVGVSQAEELSHSMENILKGLKSGDLALSREILDILNRGVKRLEETIIAKKEGKNLPDISGVVERLKSINAVIGKATKVKKEIDESIDRRVEAGFDVWLVKFTPSQELSEKGINVEIIKGKLEEIGEIIRINPKIGSDKKVSFEFYVATKGASEDNFSYLREFDLEYQLYRAGASSPISEQPVERRTTFIAPSNFVRVDVSKLDNLMRILGELVVTKSRLESELRNLQDIVPSQFQRELEETNRLLERYLRELRESFMSIRLVPIGEVFDRMRFVINDLIKESNKKINLEISGQETEIDKFIVEKLVDPILHLVRNAVSHGIESEEERIKKGKPPVGRLSLRAYTSGEMIVVEVEDDGRGIDSLTIAKKALELGIIKEESEVSSMDKILEIICSPDFSTKEEADRASGRGIGMTVVKNTITELGGLLSLRTEIDKGTCFILQLPITLTIIDAVIFRVGEQRYAIPQTSIREIVEVYQEQIIGFRKEKFIPYRDGTLPLVYLSEIFNIPEDNTRKRKYALVVGKEDKIVGLVVDRILTIKEAVVRPIIDPLIQNPAVSGATDLGDGKLILILNVEGIKKGGERLNVG